MNMTPVISTKHFLNRSTVKTAKPRDLADSHAACAHCAIFSHKVISQLSESVFGSSQVGRSAPQHSIAVNQVFGVCGPFKIVRAIIQEVAVNVVYLVSKKIRFEKRFRNKNRDQDRPSRIPAKVHFQISTGASRIGFEYLLTFSVAVQMALDATAIADAVSTFKTRDCFPHFSFDNWLRHFRPFYSRLICSGVRSGDNHPDAGIFNQSIAGVNL